MAATALLMTAAALPATAYAAGGSAHSPAADAQRSRAAATAAGPAAPKPAWPTGRTFRATVLIEDGVPRPIVRGTFIVVGFGPHNAVRAYAGCNQMSGTGYLIGGRLVIRALATTKMYCLGKMDQERLVSKILTRRPYWQQMGHRLRLRAGLDELRLVELLKK